MAQKIINFLTSCLVYFAVGVAVAVAFLLGFSAKRTIKEVWGVG